jgi:hypothetical protein
MRSTLLWPLALGISLLSAPAAWGQAGRYVPPLPPLGGGEGSDGVFHVLMHMAWRSGGGWILVAVGGGILLVYLVAAMVEWALGRQPPALTVQVRPAATFAGPDVDVPPPDRILRGTEVANKVRQTGQLLEVLARKDSRFDPEFLGQLIRSTFCQVQQCWQAGEYGPVAHLLMPALLKEHQDLLRSMRRNGEVNRVEDVQIRWLEFVHLSCPEEADRHEATALITFEAKVYFVDAVSGAYRRGDRRGRTYQEFWVFRRQGDAWRLQAIERSERSNRLAAENQIAGMTAAELRNAQEGVIML